MGWATLPSASISLSWIHLKDLSCPTLSNIPTRQKHLTLQGPPWHYCASLIAALQTVQDPPQPVPCPAHPSTQLLRQRWCQPVLSCPLSHFLSTPSSPVQCWKAGRGKNCAGTAGIPLQSISLMSTQTSVRPGKENISMRHKALYNCSDLLLSNFRQRISSDLTLYLVFFFAAH